MSDMQKRHHKGLGDGEDLKPPWLCSSNEEVKDTPGLDHNVRNPWSHMWNPILHRKNSGRSGGLSSQLGGDRDLHGLFLILTRSL